MAGVEANWRVREPSDQRSIRAFDWSWEGAEGDRRQRMVVRAVVYAENVVDGAVLEW